MSVRAPAFASTADAGECELNGQPAIVASQEGRPLVAVLLSVAGGRIRPVFFQADPARLKRIALVH